MTQSTPPLKTTIYTALALIAFAGNSVLCRLALSDETYDALSFTIVRLLSGALMLMFLCLCSRKSLKAKVLPNGQRTSWVSWLGPLMLFLYAALFSLAYLLIDTGVGALVLFGMVQATIISWSVYQGYRLQRLEWVGLAIAFVGFSYLMWPSSSTTVDISFLGILLMLLAGVAWGAYTLLGRVALDPLLMTAINFRRSLVFLLPLLLGFLFMPLIWSIEGTLLAIASGALTSGLGYALWYAALRGLSGVQAGVLQLLVPIMATIGGVIWVGESLSWTLLIATVAVLSGIGLVILSQNRQS